MGSPPDLFLDLKDVEKVKPRHLPLTVCLDSTVTPSMPGFKRVSDTRHKALMPGVRLAYYNFTCIVPQVV